MLFFGDFASPSLACIICCKKINEVAEAIFNGFPWFFLTLFYFLLFFSQLTW